MKLPKESIKEIAELLDCGLICYIHKQTKEIKNLPDFDQVYDYDEELWREAINEIENNQDDYVKIEKMSSSEGFRIMEEFTNQVDNKAIKNKLIYALNRNKPFRNFKYEVDYNEDIRQQWFKFKSYKYQEWVKDYLENYSFDNEEHQNKTPIHSGLYDDDGNPYNPDLYPLPNLCLTCKKRNDPNEEIVCNLTRMDQHGEPEFICDAYENEKED